jgi:hypothetical protein
MIISIPVYLMNNLTAERAGSRRSSPAPKEHFVFYNAIAVAKYFGSIHKLDNYDAVPRKTFERCSALYGDGARVAVIHLSPFVAKTG